MLVTTKGRYAMRLMAYIASFPDRKVALREVSENEAISLKYLEQLAHELVKADLLVSVRGHGGGYGLARAPQDIKAGDILRAAEGSTVPVACAALEERGACPREEICSTVSFWSGLDDVIERYVDGVTLAELVEPNSAAADRSATPAASAASASSTPSATSARPAIL